MNIVKKSLKPSMCLLIIASFVFTPVLSKDSGVYAASSKNDKIVKVAKSKQGKGIKSFPSSFNRGAWCADFVMWSAKKTNLRNNKTFPKSNMSSVSSVQSWYKKKGRYKSNKKSYTPKKGDLAFFRPNSHIGIVTKVTKKHVYVIHGNWSNKVKHTKIKRQGYDRGQRTAIKGFARPDYAASEVDFELKFKANGGEVKSTKKDIKYKKKYGALPVPEKEGYEFLGWYTKKNGGTKVTKNTKLKKRKNITIYAKWEKVIITPEEQDEDVIDDDINEDVSVNDDGKDEEPADNDHTSDLL